MKEIKKSNMDRIRRICRKNRKEIKTNMKKIKWK